MPAPIIVASKKAPSIPTNPLNQNRHSSSSVSSFSNQTCRTLYSFLRYSSGCSIAKPISSWCSFTFCLNFLNCLRLHMWYHCLVWTALLFVKVLELQTERLKLGFERLVRVAFICCNLILKLFSGISYVGFLVPRLSTESIVLGFFVFFTTQLFCLSSWKMRGWREVEKCCFHWLAQWCFLPASSLPFNLSYRFISLH